MGDWAAQRSYINGCVKIIPVKRKRTSNNESRRSFTYEHYLIRQNVQVKVCQQFLISTLRITQRVIRNSIKGKLEVIQDQRGKHGPKHKITNSQKQNLDSFIKRLPAVPSHYCRGSSSKLYLPADILTFTNLYKMYSHNNEDKISLSSFKRIIRKDYNIGIHVPKKDKCISCEKYKNLPNNLKNGEEEEKYLQHLRKKEDAKHYFLKEQNRRDPSTVIASFDLQKVLTTPHGSSMLIGFSRKYACYNFTIYESGSANGYCYFWGEKDGKRGANEICSHVFAYLSHLDQLGEKECVHFFCDNCPGQNKIKHMMAMLTYFLNTSNIIKKVIITYLVPGHTYMPVDSIHANIERKIEKMFIQAPSEWPTILRNSGKRSYEVIVAKYSSFLDWKSVTPSKKLKDTDNNDLKLSDVVEIIYDKSNVKVKKSYSETEIPIEIPFQLKTITKDVPKAYNTELPINQKKNMKT